MAAKRIIGLILLAILALLAYALKEGLSDDHQVGIAAWYTLSLLGFISNLFGMGYTMIGAVIVTMGYLVLIAAFGLWMIYTPRPVYSEFYATTIRRHPAVPLGTKITISVIYLVGGIACVGVIWILWF